MLPNVVEPTEGDRCIFNDVFNTLLHACARALLEIFMEESCHSGDASETSVRILDFIELAQL